MRAGAPAESVWEYPRPPRVEPTERRIRIVFGGETIVGRIKGAPGSSGW
ncbi:MAG TPA: hypothetical protein VMN35_08215 [Gaiellaceae bacterium]|nr:hypothetical protein [Gaiellaceae bacterium]